jgi:hypothetical protein
MVVHSKEMSKPIIVRFVITTRKNYKLTYKLNNGTVGYVIQRVEKYPRYFEDSM